MATRAQLAERAEAVERLHKILAPGDTVHTILRHVSRSGLMRHVSVIKVGSDGPNDISWLVGRVLGEKRAEDGGVKISGAGMDMGFELVYCLSSALWPQGFECAGERCDSNDHTNGDRNRVPHHHGDGGYALRQKWM